MHSCVLQQTLFAICEPPAWQSDNPKLECGTGKHQAFCHDASSVYLEPARSLPYTWVVSWHSVCHMVIYATKAALQVTQWQHYHMLGFSRPSWVPQFPYPQVRNPSSNLNRYRSATHSIASLRHNVVNAWYTAAHATWPGKSKLRLVH